MKTKIKFQPLLKNEHLYFIFSVEKKENSYHRKFFNLVQCTEETIYSELNELNELDEQSNIDCIMKLSIIENETFDYCYRPHQIYKPQLYFEARRIKKLH